MSDDRLPELVDAPGLRRELGVTRAAADKIMQQLQIVRFPDLEKVYVYRADVVALLEASTFQKDEVPTT